MKITRRKLRRIIKEALGDRGDLPKKRQPKIGMQGPEDLPYGNVTGKKPAYNTGPKGRPTVGSTRQYLAANYDDFIDLHIKTSSAPEMFWDRWEDHCEDKGIPCTQDHLVALVDRAEEMGEVEEGELFVGERGAW
jgi:hypothetical protein